MDTACVFDTRIKELLPFAEKTKIVQKAIHQLKYQKKEEEMLKKIENELAVKIYAQLELMNPHPSRIEFARFLTREYLLFEGFTETVDVESASQVEQYEMCGYQNEVFLFRPDYEEIKRGTIICLAFERIEHASKSGIRPKKFGYYQFRVFPVFLNEARDTNLIFEELKELRAALKRVWESLNLKVTPASSQN